MNTFTIRSLTAFIRLSAVENSFYSRIIFIHILSERDKTISINRVFFQGDHIWLEPASKGEFAVSIGARVKFHDKNRINIVDDDGREHWIDLNRPMRHMHATSVDGVEDMILLGDLNESGILRNLFIRYMDNLIYVR